MKILSVLFVATLLIASCTKFDEGRSVMMVKSKLARTWELTKFEINGNNQDLSNFAQEITFTKEDTYTLKLTVPIFGTSTETGIWEFGDVKSKIRTKEDGETEWSEYTTIMALSSKEMIGQLIEDGVTYRYTYTAK